MSQRAAAYVIDANILFGAFISGKEIYQLLFSGNTIYLPDFAFLEIEKYKARILRKTKLPEEHFQAFVLRILRDVTVIPGLLISSTTLRQAQTLCAEIDEKDTMYVATAIEMNAALVTNDKILRDGLRELDGSPQVELLGDVLREFSTL